MEPSWGYGVLWDWFAPRLGQDVLETELLAVFFPDAFSDGPGLALFRKHFLLYRRLWQFDDELRTTTGHRLWIRSIRVTLMSPPAEGTCGWLDPETGRYCGTPAPGVCDRHAGTAPDTHTLKGYYLDASHLEGMTEEGVADLMNGFYRWWDRRGALEVLGLGADASDEAITARWRKLSLEHHPDRGGDPAAFRRLTQAVATLRKGP